MRECFGARTFSLVGLIMVEVPFDKLGPGQSGRLVYQVMGGNGPIFNPSGIRFMGPNGVSGADTALGGQVPGLFSLTGAVGLLDLGLSTANLGVSIATLQTVRRVESKVDRIWLDLELQTGQIREIAQRLERVDTNVAEQNLRSALKHVLSRASTTDGFDLTSMEPLFEDLDKFTDSVTPWGFGLSPNLRLSSDVRGMLGAVWHLVLGAQLTWISTHNQIVGGDPERCRRHPLDDYTHTMFAMLPNAIIDRLQLQIFLESAPDELGALVYDRFTWASENDRKGYASWMRERICDGTSAILATTNPIASALATQLGPVLPEIESDQDLDAPWIGSTATWRRGTCRTQAWCCARCFLSGWLKTRTFGRRWKTTEARPRGNLSMSTSMPRPSRRRARRRGPERLFSPTPFKDISEGPTQMGLYDPVVAWDDAQQTSSLGRHRVLVYPKVGSSQPTRPTTTGTSHCLPQSRHSWYLAP